MWPLNEAKLKDLNLLAATVRTHRSQASLALMLPAPETELFRTDLAALLDLSLDVGLISFEENCGHKGLLLMNIKDIIRPQS